MAINNYQVSVPEGQSGNWKVERFTVTGRDAEIERIRAMFSGRRVPEGTYTRLMRRGQVIMSDTPDEIRDHLEPIRRARGSVLINGLGLGVVLQAALNKPEVRHVTVVEKSPDVIKLVAWHYYERFGYDRLTVVEGDAFDWKIPKGARFDVVWHDIWDNLCADNLREMSVLHRKFGRRTDWQGSWGRELCRRYARSGY
jgi:hypothetical protein